MAAADAIEAVVLRTLRYGEADLIAHVHARGEGKRGVIAKGARKPRSRLGARLEPFLVVQLQLIATRSDLATVRNVEIIDAHEHLRSSWQAQQVGAAALDLVAKLAADGEPNDAMHHLLRSFLGHLDAAAADAPTIEARGTALLAAFELKLLHAIGLTPQLGSCVRCGDAVGIVAYSAADGGVVCSTCRIADDAFLAAATHGAAVELLRDSLADIAARDLTDRADAPTLRALRTDIVAGTARAHAGVSVRRPL